MAGGGPGAGRLPVRVLLVLLVLRVLRVVRIAHVVLILLVLRAVRLESARQRNLFMPNRY